MKKTILVTFLSFFLISACKSRKDTKTNVADSFLNYDLSMYPKSSKALNRFVISLPVKANEGLYNLEIWSGKTKLVDCNKQIISGKFNKHTIKGWGYSYYEFIPNDHQLSTKMACPDTTLVEKFIRSNTEHIRYNSKLPVVVYCPKEYQVQYAIWSKNETPIKAIVK